MKTPSSRMQKALSAMSSFKPWKTHVKILDTSRTCDADKLRCRASLSPIAFSFRPISCLISERCCYIAQPLFCLGFRGFHGPKENDND